MFIIELIYLFPLNFSMFSLLLFVFCVVFKWIKSEIFSLKIDEHLFVINVFVCCSSNNALCGVGECGKPSVVCTSCELPLRWTGPSNPWRGSIRSKITRGRESTGKPQLVLQQQILKTYHQQKFILDLDLLLDWLLTFSNNLLQILLVTWNLVTFFV